MKPQALSLFLAWPSPGSASIAYGKQGILTGSTLQPFGHRKDGSFQPLTPIELPEKCIIWEADNLRDYLLGVNARQTWEKVSGTDTAHNELDGRGTWWRLTKGKLWQLRRCPTK